MPAPAGPRRQRRRAPRGGEPGAGAPAGAARPAAGRRRGARARAGGGARARRVAVRRDARRRRGRSATTAPRRRGSRSASPGRCSSERPRSRRGAGARRRPPARRDRRARGLRGHARGAAGSSGSSAAAAVAVRRRAGAARGRHPGRALPSGDVSTDAYARSGVDQHVADRAVAALVAVLKTIDTGKPSRSVLASGHYAAVLEVAPNLGIAVGTDGVGSKLILAEQTGRYDTVGIDCVAMNVNDVVCVGAEPIALLDYLAVEQADPAVMEQIGIGLKTRRRAGRGRDPRRRGRDPARADPRPSVAATASTSPPRASARSRSTRSITGETIAPGDALIGLPEQRPALELLLARAPRGRGPPARRPVRRRHARRRAARADRDLRARRARADPLRRRRPRPRPHHRRRAAEPAAPQRGASASRSRTRCRSRRSSTSSASAGRSPTPRRGRSSTWAAASSPSSRTARRGRRRRAARRAPPRHPPDRHRHRPGRPRQRPRRGGRRVGSQRRLADHAVHRNDRRRAACHRDRSGLPPRRRALCGPLAGLRRQGSVDVYRRRPCLAGRRMADRELASSAADRRRQPCDWPGRLVQGPVLAGR